MTTHISVLPLGVIDTLTQQLNGMTCPDLNFLRLPHPRTGIPSLFLPHKGNGRGRNVNEEGTTEQTTEREMILEVQTIEPDAPRSWFLGDEEVVSDGKLVLMTPVDPVFLLIPILDATLPADGSPGNFRTLDDIFETALTNLTGTSSTNSESKEGAIPISSGDVMKFVELQSSKDAMRRVCEYKDLTEDIAVFRYSRQKVTEYMVKKVNRLSKSTVDTSKTMTRELAKDGLLDDGKEALLESGRVKLACDLVSQYLPPHLSQELLSKFDFNALNAHIQSLQKLSMVTAVPSSSKDKESTNKTEGDGKKRKAASQSSRGVEKLKKADVKGMAKLSKFFQKKDAPSKA